VKSNDRKKDNRTLLLEEKKSEIEQSRNRFRDYGSVDDPPGFQAGWSDYMHFSFLSFCSFCLLIWDFRVRFILYQVKSKIIKLEETPTACI
jgi:hypothetical protein